MRTFLIHAVAVLAIGTHAAAAQDADTELPNVLVVATGGTIAGKASGTSAVGYTAGQVTGADLIAAVPGIEKLADLTTAQVSNIGSQDMNDDVWIKLAKRIEQAFAGGEADGVVVTHGTDTLEETAFFLEQVLATDKPVVLVGAMRPATAISADGPGNLFAAVRVAASDDAKGRGVLVVFNERIFESRDVQKTNTTAVQTFRAPNAGPVGYVNAAAVRFIEPAGDYPRPRFAVSDKVPLPRVEIIYAHSHMTADLIDCAVDAGAKGIVLAGVGNGNASKAALAALERHAKDGVVVVRSTRVGSGYTQRNAEIDDDKCGFAAALDLNPQKARILVQLLLRDGVTDMERVQREIGVR
jgi:L-asparaginase